MSEQRVVDKIDAFAREMGAENASSSLDFVDSNYSDQCESPIERIMMLALEAVFTAYSIPLADFVPGDEVEKYPGRCERGLWWIATQLHIGDYRVDFAIFRADKIALVIECDGHNFHERTPDQAARDRSRDREIQARGHRVFRFTGREIWRDPIGCAKQALKAAEAVAHHAPEAE